MGLVEAVGMAGLGFGLLEGEQAASWDLRVTKARKKTVLFCVPITTDV